MIGDMQAFDLVRIEEHFKVDIEREKNTKAYQVLEFLNSTLIKNLIWQLKFKGQKNIAKILGHFIGEYILKLINESKIKNFIIIPVPIHRKRRLERGFNQTELISKYIKKYLNSKNINNFYVDTKNLKKIKETKKQSWKNKTERLKKNENIFYIKDKEIFNNKIIFIIDDVVTTGKTLQDIKEELNKTNPKKIIGICFAGG
jgi:ComF family protein